MNSSSCARSQAPAAPVDANARAFAQEALAQRRRAKTDFWPTAMEAEAQAILGDREASLTLCGNAVRAAR